MITRIFKCWTQLLLSNDLYSIYWISTHLWIVNYSVSQSFHQIGWKLIGNKSRIKISTSTPNANGFTMTLTCGSNVDTLKHPDLLGELKINSCNIFIIHSGNQQVQSIMSFIIFACRFDCFELMWNGTRVFEFFGTFSLASSLNGFKLKEERDRKWSRRKIQLMNFIIENEAVSM